MSKLMTAYMVFEALKEGRLKLNDTLPVSEQAWRMSGSQMFVKVGDRVPVEDLIRGIIIQSGNDACIVFAEALAGTEAAFAERDDREGARSSASPTATSPTPPASPIRSQLMSVHDLAILAHAIIHDFPEYYHYYSREASTTYNNIRQPNRNPLLQAGIPGVDGMKTGFTKESGYGLVASAERNGRRLIMVLAGLEFDPAAPAGGRGACSSTPTASSRSTGCSSPARRSPRPTCGRAPRPRCRWWRRTWPASRSRATPARAWW